MAESLINLARTYFSILVEKIHRIIRFLKSYKIGQKGGDNLFIRSNVFPSEWLFQVWKQNEN